MKKTAIGISVVLIGLAVFLLGFNHKREVSPRTYYQVYLDEEVIGTIQSKKEMEKYIDARGDYIKKKYNVSKIYAPEGMRIEAITTYLKAVDSVKSVYEKIEKARPFTIKGYQLTIREEENTQKLYATNRDVFKNAIVDTIDTFLGKDRYSAYVSDTQPEITATGSLLENVYIDNEMSIKEVNIPINSTIYHESSMFAKYLLFGTTEDQKTYKIQAGDTIENISLRNKISVEEFLISNPQFKSANSLLYPGQEVVIGVTDPKIKVVSEEYTVEDVSSKYKTEEKVDDNMIIGDEKVLQEGENGLERVSSKVKTTNGVIVYVKPVEKAILKPSINKVIVKGTKNVPNVGGSIWDWPTNSGWTLSSGYEWRIDPFTHVRSFHTGLDIAGTGYDSPIYAVNNGEVYIADSHYSYGNYVVINHNNGYYTLYAHMDYYIVKPGQVVARGQKIGFVGSTGDSTGPHLHIEVWKNGPPFEGGTRLSPWVILG